MDKSSAASQVGHDAASYHQGSHQEFPTARRGCGLRQGPLPRRAIENLCEVWAAGPTGKPKGFPTPRKGRAALKTHTTVTHLQGQAAERQAGRTQGPERQPSPKPAPYADGLSFQQLVHAPLHRCVFLAQTAPALLAAAVVAPDHGASHGIDVRGLGGRGLRGSRPRGVV